MTNENSKILSKLLFKKTTTSFAGVHDVLSARIAEEVGFEALWLSGFGLATSLGYRDASEICPKHILDYVERITSVCKVPILCDCDSGFGNFNNIRLLASQLRLRHAGGICIEDKKYPKMNSFIDSSQDLLPKNQFVSKLRAVKDTVASDLVLVARTEALICGLSVEEALDRAAVYQEAGADAVLVHSKAKEPTEILKFLSGWVNECPVIIVPTTYKVSTDTFSNTPPSAIIWANQALRSSALAIKNSYISILANKSGEHNYNLCTLQYLFSLMNYDELREAEIKYKQY